VFENRVLKRIFGSKREDATGDWRKLHNEELRNFYFLPSKIRMIKSGRMIWVGHVVRIGRRGLRVAFWWESQRERYH
jgi:hypothetical protein